MLKSGPSPSCLCRFSPDNSDLIACMVVSKDGGQAQRFLAVDVYQMSLVEPETKRLGWGVVKFAGLLQVREPCRPLKPMSPLSFFSLYFNFFPSIFLLFNYALFSFIFSFGDFFSSYFSSSPPLATNKSFPFLSSSSLIRRRSRLLLFFHQITSCDA